MFLQILENFTDCDLEVVSYLDDTFEAFVFLFGKSGLPKIVFVTSPSGPLFTVARVFETSPSEALFIAARVLGWFSAAGNWFAFFPFRIVPIWVPAS